MKIVTRTLWVFILAFAVVYQQCMAQQQPDFSSLSLEQAEKMLPQAAKEDFVKMARSALHSRRLDLISLCFDRYETRQHIFEETNKIADEKFKAKVVLLMLLSDSRFWPQDNYETGFQPPVLFIDPIKSVVTKHFPGEHFGNDVIATSASRRALAARLAIAVGDSMPNDATPVGQTSLKLKKSPISQAPPAKSELNLAPSAEAQSLSGSVLWLTGGALVLAALIWCVWSKRRSA